MCLCFPTAAGSDQGWQRCDFCHRPLPLPRKQSTGSPGAIPSLGGQGRLGQHCLRRDQVSLTCRSRRSISPSTGGSNPAETPVLPHASGSPHPIPAEECALAAAATSKIRERKEKRSQTVFACRARSALEAAPVEIINESRFRDLSKWTGNKSVLIGHQRGRRQGGGRWFSCQREG